MANPYNFFIDPFKGFNKVVETFTTSGSGNWTCPAGVTSIYVECWGGGGDGGYVDDNEEYAGGGGGGGGAYAAGYVSVTPGNEYAYYVGVNTGVYYGAARDGKSSSFNTNSIIAVGGKGGAKVSHEYSGTLGAGGAGGSAANCTGTVKYSGGNGAAGWIYYDKVSIRMGGGGGGGAGTTGAGGSATSYNSNAYIGGTGTAEGGGDGGDSVPTSGTGSAAGQNGSAYGGGGGGANSNALVLKYGGTGGPGAVRITYYT